jgi:hypothetical protein
VALHKNKFCINAESRLKIRIYAEGLLTMPDGFIRPPPCGQGKSQVVMHHIVIVGYPDRTLKKYNAVFLILDLHPRSYAKRYKNRNGG